MDGETREKRKIIWVLLLAFRRNAIFFTFMRENAAVFLLFIKIQLIFQASNSTLFSPQLEFLLFARQKNPSHEMPHYSGTLVRLLCWCAKKKPQNSLTIFLLTETLVLLQTPINYQQDLYLYHYRFPFLQSKYISLCVPKYNAVHRIQFQFLYSLLRIF